jgi:transcriptional regulator with XRE-family HTH domain
MAKTPNPIDKHVGARLRMRRLMVGMSQGKLGEALDVTFQQIQKYEKGANRIGASRLQQLARVLEVPPPSVPMTMRHRPPGSLALRAQVKHRHGHAPHDSRRTLCRRWR